jgi:1,2-diacylglycerol 3-alpha-glucosyltransferase
MHIAMFLDQHPESLGGAQLSARVQRRYLERAGHLVTICAPRSFRSEGTTADSRTWLTAAFPITSDREYSATVPSLIVDRSLDRAAASAPPVDIVHVQADYWQAIIGLRFARRHKLPVVITMHNRVDVGVAATVLFPRFTLWVLETLQRLSLARAPLDALTPKPGAWRLLRRLAREAKAVIAPSHHFAELLRSEQVAESVDVIPTGLDDDLLRSIPRHDRRTPRERPILVWSGRMSAEKRLLEFLEAIALSRPDVDVHLYGAGRLHGAAERLVESTGIGDRVTFMGEVPYPDMLTAIASADALVQSSRGFETQGLTISEAVALGTPVVVCDPAIANELPADSFWLAEDGSVEALAELLTRVASELTAGTAPAPTADEANLLLESTRVAELVRVYERVLAP